MINLRLQLKWLTTTLRITYKTLTLLHKILISTEPAPIFDDFIYSNNTRLLRYSSTPLLEDPPYKFTKFGKKTFRRKASNLWNRLPRNLMTIYITFSIFKKRIKKNVLLTTPLFKSPISIISKFFVLPRIFVFSFFVFLSFSFSQSQEYNII